MRQPSGPAPSAPRARSDSCNDDIGAGLVVRPELSPLLFEHAVLVAVTNDVVDGSRLASAGADLRPETRRTSRPRHRRGNPPEPRRGWLTRFRRCETPAEAQVEVVSVAVFLEQSLGSVRV